MLDLGAVLIGSFAKHRYVHIKDRRRVPELDLL
jgi:hypothetical protein